MEVRRDSIDFGKREVIENARKKKNLGNVGMPRQITKRSGKPLVVETPLVYPDVLVTQKILHNSH